MASIAVCSDIGPQLVMSPVPAVPDVPMLYLSPSTVGITETVQNCNDYRYSGGLLVQENRLDYASGGDSLWANFEG